MCEHPELQAFLEGKIPSGEEQPWLDHLESCPKCQARIEEMAADRNWWQDARTFLSTDSGIAALATPVETAAESEEAGHEPISLDFLAPTDDPESLGRLGTYEVTGVIGRGGSGIVLKAFDRSLNRNVAIKVLSPHLATSGAARKRFAREGQAAAAVVHEHVIPIFAVAAHQNLPYIVMQYFPGRSLQQRLDRDGPLELREILRIGLQTARGLAAAHAQGLIHRDVKPANILLADGIERVTLSDFGLARALDDARLTRTGWLAGTPEYMSPEQSRGKGMDARSDLFSLGSVLYTASTGRVPFQAETSYGTLRQVTDDEPAPIRQVNADIPEWLCVLIGKLMAKAPENRFASAEEVANLLEACLAHVQQPESTQLPESLIVKKPQPQRASFFGGRTLVALLLGFAGFIAGGFALWQVSAPPDIAGRWTGEDWGQVQLKHLGSGEYEGTYTDTFGKAPGTIHLNWSRIERRFFGTWREGEDRFGELSIRLVKDEIRGALITDAKSKINPATPRLADLLWVKEGRDGSVGDKKDDHPHGRWLGGLKGDANSGKQDPSERGRSHAEPGALNQEKTGDSGETKDISRQLQGNWVTVKKLDENGKDQLVNKAEVWMIHGNSIHFGSSDEYFYEMKVVGQKYPAEIDLILRFKQSDDKILDGQISGRCLIKIQNDKLFVCQGSRGVNPEKLAPNPGCIYYELVRIPKIAQADDRSSAREPKGQYELFKQVPYLNRLFVKPNADQVEQDGPLDPYRLNRGPRLICHQGPMETNGYFGIHLTRRSEDRVVTCSFGGTSYRMYWKYLGWVPFPSGEPGDVYEIKRRAPANSENPVLSTRMVVYRGSRVKVFDDGNPSVIIEVPNFHNPAPEIADARVAMVEMKKKLADTRNLECELTIAQSSQPEKALQYYRRDDQVCLEEPAKRRIIWDFKSNRVIDFDLAGKTAAIFDWNQSKVVSLSKLRNRVDFLHVLRSFAGQPASYELTEKVQGLYCDLYHVIPEKSKASNGPFAVWLNQTTHLPAILEGCLADHGGTFSLSSFRWNPSLKDNLFSFEIPAGFTVVGRGDAPKFTENPATNGTDSQGFQAGFRSHTWPTIRIKVGNGPSAEIIERTIRTDNSLKTFKLGGPGMEWEVTCLDKGKMMVESGPVPEIFELQWKFMGDNRLPSQKTGSQTAFLIGKASKVVDEPDFSIELIPCEIDANVAGASGAKSSLAETVRKLNDMQSAIFSTKYKDSDRLPSDYNLHIKGPKTRAVYEPDNFKIVNIADASVKKFAKFNDQNKIAFIGKEEGYGASVPNRISTLNGTIDSWGHEYIYSELVHGKTCDLYRIWPSRPSTIPYNHLGLIWIDQATNLPVMQSAISPSGMHSVTKFQWNPPLPDSLFSMEIPKDYTLTSYEEFMKQSTPSAGETKRAAAGDSAATTVPSALPKQGILAKLQGRWKPVLAYRGLTKLSDESARREFALEISKDRLEFVSESDGSRSWMTIELNNDENPFQMDLVREHVSGRCVGVVEGNKLRLCQGTAYRQAKKAQPTEGLNYTEYERTDRLPYEDPKAASTAPVGTGTTPSNATLRFQMTKVLEAYQGEWTVARCIDENLQQVDVSHSAQAEEPWIVFGESFTIAGMAADHVQTVFTVPGKPIKIELVFKRPIGDSTSSADQRELRIPSIWNLEGEQLRVILGKEGKDPEKLEPTLGFKYFELARAEKRPRPKPSDPASSGASTGPQSEKPDNPNGAGPNLVIVQTAPGDAGRTVEPMGQDERQMVRIVGNGANQTEIRWSYQGKLSFEPGFEVPIYELQWKYLGTHPPALQKEGSKTVYFQGLPIKLAHFSSIQFTVESAQNEPRLTGGSKPKSSFEGMIERLSQAKSCILDHQIFEKTDRISISNIYWIKNQSIRFCNSYGFEKTIKDDRALNKRLTLISSSKLAREVILPKDQQLYSGEIKHYFEHYRTRKSKFLYSTTIDSKKCDVYQSLPKENDKDSAATQPLFWIEQGTNLPLRLREPGFSGNYHDVQFQLDVPIDEAAFSAEIPPGFALEKKGEIDRLERRYLDWYQRGLKIGVPLPNFKNLQAEKKAKAAEIQGTWQVVKKINDDFRDEKITDAKKQTWTIQGDELTSGGEEKQKARIDVVDIWPIFSVNFIPQSTGLPNNLGFPLKASGRIPSLWSLQGGKLRVAIGKEGQPLWKLEPAVGVQYFELVRKAEGPSELDPRAASPLPETIVPKGKGPNLVIVYSVPGDTWKTVEPMGQDPQQMVRVVGNEANQTEIRWAYQGTLVLADGSKIPIYEFQWKYLGSAPAAGKAADAIVVYFQGNRMKLVDFPGISLFVAPTGNDKNGAQGANSNRSFDASFEWVVQAKSCTAQVEIFAKTDRISTERIFWTASKYAETEVRHGFETVAKGDSQRNKQIVIAPSMKLLKERTALQSRRSYEGPLSEIAQFYRNQPAEFLRADTVDGKSCDIYQVYAKVEDGAQKRLPSLFWIEQSTKRLIKLREPLPFGYFRSVSFQIDAVIDPAVWAMNVPAEFVPDQNDEIARQIKMLDQHFQKGLKLGQPAPQAKNLSADVKRKRDLIQGSWVPVKTIDEKYRDVKTADLERTIWTIEENRLIMGGSSSAAQKMEILDAWPIFQVELTRDPRFALNMLSSRTGPVPSLWSLDDQVLRVAIGEQGKPPLRLGPAPGVRYFELVRLTMSDSKELSKSMGVDLGKSEMPKAGVGSLAAGASSLFADQNSMTRAASDPFIPRNFLAGMLLNQEPVKKRILAALEGEWVTTKHVEQNTSGKDESSKPGVVWILQGDSFASSIAPGSPIRMAVIDSTGPTRIEFYLAVSLPRSDGSPSLRIIRVPSLWTLVGNQLKVAIGKEGQKLDRLEPAPGVKYFELVRKPAQSKSDQASPQNPAASHWLFPWAVANGPKPEVTTENANPTFNLPSSNPDHLPQTSATRASTVVTEIKKDEILSQISGRWVVSKQSRWNRMTGEVVETTGDVWEITGEKLKSLSRFDLSVELEVMATEPHLQIDWIYPGPNRLLRGPFNSQGGRVASLWAIEKGKLKVVILEGGRYPEKLEPGLGCIYFELIPKEPAIPTAGFPTEFQGQWKLTKTIGIDLREESFNRDAMVTIARNQLQIGKEVKKAELVQSGNPFRMNLIAPMPMAAEEVRVPSLWELRGDRLCFNSGKELPAKVGPSPGIYYFELTRVVEPKHSNPGEPGNPLKVGTASQGQGDSGPAADAAKAASFQKMVERLKNAQSASFEVTHANQPGLPQVSATARHLIRGKQVRIDQMIEGTVLVTRIVDSALKKGVLINHNNKTAKEFDFSKTGENIRRTPMDMNFLRMIVEGFSPDKDGPQLRRSEVKIFYLRTENLEGKACDVYRVFPSQADDENKGGPWMVWVDSQSHDLVSIRGQARSETFTLSHFQWNLSLDDSSFKLDVPQGFQIADNWIDAWAAKLESTRPLPARKMEPPQKRDANKNAAPDGAASKQSAPQLHPMQ